MFISVGLVIDLVIGCLTVFVLIGVVLVGVLG